MRAGRVAQAAVPPLAAPVTHGSLADIPFANAAEAPDEPVLSRKGEGGRRRDITAAAFRDEVLAVAKGLVACGLRPGDRLAIMSRTTYEWTLLDFAAWAAGLITVPVHPTSSASQGRLDPRRLRHRRLCRGDGRAGQVGHLPPGRAAAAGAPVAARRRCRRPADGRRPRGARRSGPGPPRPHGPRHRRHPDLHLRYRRPALLTLDPEDLEHWKRMRGKAEARPGGLVSDPELPADLQPAVDDTNSTVSRAESIRRFTVLPVEFTEHSGHLTPSMKLRRAVVAADFVHEIELLYAAS